MKKHTFSNKEIKELEIEINKRIDESYRLGKEYILSILKDEIRCGLRDGYMGIRYSCLLDLIKELENNK